MENSYKERAMVYSEGYKRFKRNLINLEDDQQYTRMKTSSRKPPTELLSDILEGNECILSAKKIPKFKYKPALIPRTPENQMSRQELAELFHQLCRAGKQENTRILIPIEKHESSVVNREFARLEYLFDFFSITPLRPVTIPEQINRVHNQKTKPRIQSITLTQ